MASEDAAYEMKYNRQENRLRMHKNKTRSLLLEAILVFVREMLGTAVYVYIGCFTTQRLNSPHFSQGLIYAALQACACPYLVGTGGVHLNPACSIGAAIAGKLPRPLIVIPMIIFQFIGCLIGAGLHRGTVPEQQYMSGSPNVVFALSKYSTVELVQLCFGEALLTCVLVTVFVRLYPRSIKSEPLTKGQLRYKKYCHAIFVGLTIVAATEILNQDMLIGFVNPFRAFGQRAVIAGEMKRLDLEQPDMWTGHWIYWVGPIIASIVAGVIERVRDNMRRMEEKAKEENTPMA